MNSKDKVSLLWEAVEYWAVEKPEAEALVYGDQRLTWADLAARVRALANAFEEMGIQPGDCIAQISMARPEFIITFMAAARVGAMWTGLSPKFSHEEIYRILSDCQPVLLVIAAEHQGESMLDRALLLQAEFPWMLPPLIIGEADTGDLPAYDAVIHGASPERAKETETPLRADDPVLIMYTSGSSGTPKGVIHTHRTLLENVACESECFGITGDSRFLLHFPINHVAADVEFGLCSLYVGATLVMLDHFSAAGALDTIERENISVVGQVPAMYAMEFASPDFCWEKFRTVRTFIWGGSIASQTMIHKLAEICRKTGAHMLTGYGATELGGFASCTKADETPFPGDSGYIYPQCQVRIVDKDRCALPVGETGEIAIRGPILMSGYLNKPALTDEVVDRDGWYYTRDLGRLQEDGRLEILGRISEMFKSGGENIFPSEVEAVLEAHPKIMFAAVIGVPDPVYDEVGFAFLVPTPGEKLAIEEVEAYCKKHMASFKTPKYLRICVRLPLLPNGKVDKVTLRKSLEEKRM